MCGICGIFGRVDEPAITVMLQAISHRGPDSFHVTSTQNASLGGCRLQIVGSAADPLPLLSDNRECCVLLNGELYNHRTLNSARDLHNGKCESETILALYERVGSECFGLMTGMFAVAIIDGQRLLLSRDRFGIKPLFYTRCGSDVLFASEIKAILRYPKVNRVIDHEALEQIAVFGYIVDSERTILRDIKQVPPGTTLLIEDNQVTANQYYRMPASQIESNGPSLRNTSDELNVIAGRTIKEMMSHDRHNKGFYLSGGLDSSYLVSLACTEDEVSTFTMADTVESADFQAAGEVATALGTDHHSFLVDLNDYLEEFPHFVYHFENVVAGGVFDIHGGIAFQMLSRRIADHVKVAFSGEGADELFGGYYWAYTHPLGFSDRIRSRLERFGSNGKTAAIVDALFPQPEDELEYQKNLFDFLMGSGLSNYHLWSVDRSSAAFGFEVRPAFLHYNIVDFALDIPIEYKCTGIETKRVLKESARTTFDEAGIGNCISRKKIGMPAAVGNIALEFEELAQRWVPQDSLINHPYSKYLINPTEVVFFDLFYYLFIVNAAQVPTGFNVHEFYEDGINASMYG